MRRFVVLAALAAILGGCATTEAPRGRAPAMSADEGRALVRGLLPERLPDRSGWATDIHAAIAALDIAPTVENACAAIAVAEQESGLRVDPPVPGLSRIARRELEARRERAGIPKLVVDAALALPSSNGKTYAERLDAVTTEGQLSELYEDLIGRVPFGRTLFADRNPVRTGGPMQVGIAFAEAQIEAAPYPYPIASTVRHEVFTRRGGLYFGIAHLLDYPAPYDSYRYRFADYNAGRYASRNAAFQAALTQVSGIPLARDGDLLRYDGVTATAAAGSTERAARVVASRLGLTASDVRRDLEQGKREDFAKTPLYVRVFAQADALARRRAARAVVPTIELRGPKITRKLTTEWFAQRVETRFRECLGRSAR
ncbi:MAG: DUF1615 domain-containing protein [Rudaea sp.]